MAKFNPRKTRMLTVINAVLKPFFSLSGRAPKIAKVDRGPVNNIAIIAAMMIGDTIMLIPSLRVLRNNFPSTHTTIIGEARVKTILEDQKLVDHFIIIKTPWLNKGSFIGSFFRAISIIRKDKLVYDWVIDFRGDWRNIFLMSFVKSRRKISFDFSGGEYMLTDIVPSPGLTRHYIDEWLYLLTSLGCEIKDDDRYPQLVINDNNFKLLSDFKKKNNLGQKFIVGVHPGASKKSRMWSEENYANLLLRISQTYANLAIVLFEGPNESNSVTRILDILKPANIDPVVVNVGLKEYIVLMKSVNMLICNDSGAGHVAGAYNIPSVVLFGKSDPATVRPYNKSISKIISKRQSAGGKGKISIDDEAYFRAISVDEVFDAAAEILNDNLKVINGVAN